MDLQYSKASMSAVRMLILKLAAVTCAFYLAAAVLMEVVLIMMTHFLGGIWGFFPKRWGWIIVFGSVWLASFVFAFRIVMTPMLAGAPRWPWSGR